MRLARVWFLWGIFAASGCGGEAVSPRRPLPSYAGHAKNELFDDAIEARAVGLELERPPLSPRRDPLLRERTQTGDAVLRVRIDTVTARDDGVNERYDLGLRVLDKLAGAEDVPVEFTVQIDNNSPSLGIVRSFRGRLGGKVFIAFIREFARPDGDPETHFHLAEDGKAVELAVREAATSAGSPAPK